MRIDSVYRQAATPELQSACFPSRLYQTVHGEPFRWLRVHSVATLPVSGGRSGKTLQLPPQISNQRGRSSRTRADGAATDSGPGFANCLANHATAASSMPAVPPGAPARLSRRLRPAEDSCVCLTLQGGYIMQDNSLACRDPSSFHSCPLVRPPLAGPGRSCQ